MGTMVFRPTTQWAQGPLDGLAHVVKRLKPTYHIKTIGRQPRRENPKESQDVFPRTSSRAAHLEF